MSKIEKLKFFAGGEWHESKTAKYMDIYDPSTGAVIAKTPCCTEVEVKSAIKSAAEAFPSWSETPAVKGVTLVGSTSIDAPFLLCAIIKLII